LFHGHPPDAIVESGGELVAKSTPSQTFAKIFATWVHPGTEEQVRKAAERSLDAWLKRHGKTRADIPSILAQAGADDAAQDPSTPSPPPPDPRDTTPHPFDDQQFTPAGVVDGLVGKYVVMHPHVRTVFSLWVCFTHVYQQFAIAPRIALVSEEPTSGKTTAVDVARRLVRRPNAEALGTGAAIGDFLDGGPGTVLLDELDQVDEEGRRRLHLIWNLGHKRGASYGMMVKGKRKIISLYAPMIAAGIGGFLAATQKSRTFVLEMEEYDENTKPEREYTTEEDFSDFDIAYSYLRHWSRSVKLNPKPDLSLITRHADNARGLISIADSCGAEWSQRAREAIRVLFDKVQAERPQVTIVRHGLAIFDGLGIEQIESVLFNRELKRLPLSDAKWTQYRGASGVDYTHPLTIGEQASLLARVNIHSVRIRLADGRQRRGYHRAQFVEALRNSASSSHRLRLVADQ
jgi:Protein of unknown function (DUF3631)